MTTKKILVYGAGPLGSLLAVRLHEGGNAVSLLARGKRLAALRQHGIILKDFMTGEETTTRVNVVEALAPDDAYDLVLVVMRKVYALDILPTLEANCNTPNILFLMNNVGGPDKLVEALGRARVLSGFLLAAGYFEGQAIHFLADGESGLGRVLLGEVDGRITTRTQQVARVIESATGFTTEIRDDMDAWLKCHVAILMPGLGAALYAAGTDHLRLARTRDGLVLTARAIQEAIKVLQALNVPIVPPRIRHFRWIPEPLVVALLRRRIKREAMKVAMVGHANAARSELQHQIDEFLALARTTSVQTPTIDSLYSYLDPDMPLIPDSSADIPLNWWGMAFALGVFAGLPIGVRRESVLNDCSEQKGVTEPAVPPAVP